MVNLAVNVSQNHRILGLRRDLWRSSSPIPLQVPLRRLHRKMPRQVFSNSTEWDSVVSLGSLPQCTVTLKVNKCFLTFVWNFLFQFVPIALCPFAGHH